MQSHAYRLIHVDAQMLVNDFFSLGKLSLHIYTQCSAIVQKGHSWIHVHVVVNNKHNYVPTCILIIMMFRSSIPNPHRLHPFPARHHQTGHLECCIVHLQFRPLHYVQVSSTIKSSSSRGSILSNCTQAFLPVEHNRDNRDISKSLEDYVCLIPG